MSMNLFGMSVFWFVCAAPGLHAQMGRIAGTVLSAERRPIASATVVAVQSPGSRSGEPTIVRAVTAATGEFAFEQVPPGTYRLCVYEAGNYLNPCQWERSHTVVVGTMTAVVELRLRTGVTVSVRVDDPVGLFAQYRERFPASMAAKGGLLTVKVSDNAGTTVLLPLVVPSESAVLEYAALVPPDTDLTVHIASAVAELADGTGTRASATGLVTTVRVPSPKVTPADSRLPAITPIGSLSRFGVAPFVIPVQVRAISATGR